MNIQKIREIPHGIRQEIRNQLMSQQFSNKYCQKCKLFNDKINPYIEGRGSKTAKILFMGEMVSSHEDKKGQIFVKSSGNVLQNILDRHHIDYYLTNAIKCYPTKNGKSKTPTPTEIKCCNVFTMKLIQEIKPKVIVAMGKIAMKQLLPVNLALKVARGKLFYHPELKLFVIPTYHPFFLGMVDDRLLYRQFEDDISLARQMAILPPRRLIETRPRSLSFPHEIEEYLQSLLSAEVVAIDLETEGTDPKKDQITDISFCARAGEGVHISWSNMGPYFELLDKLLSSETIMKFGHNFKFDMMFFRAVGFKINNYGFDTMLAEHTHTMSLEGNEVFGMYKLETMVWHYTDLGGYEQLLGKGGIVEAQKKIKIGQKIEKETKVTVTVKKGKGKVDVEENEKIEEFIEKDPVDLLNEELDLYANFVETARKKRATDLGFDLENCIPYYSALDADSTFRIYEKQKFIIDRIYKELFYDQIIPLSYALMVMEENGLKLDLEYMNNIYEENLAAMNKAKEEFFNAVKKIIYRGSSKKLKELNGDKHKLYLNEEEEFDIQSNPQLKNIVFNILKIKKNDEFKTPKDDYSLNADAMNYYGEKNPILGKVLEYRKFQKQSSTYITGFKRFMDPVTHRVHANYLQHTTATGRLSVWSPPVQTIPKDNRIRNMVIASEGCKLIVADLSQIELRILAMLSQDKNMLGAFESGMDFHSATACKMFNIPFDNFDKENPKHDAARSGAKAINFGIVYGIGPGAIAAALSITFAEAAEYIETFHRAYPQVQMWMDRMISFAKQRGYVETLFGRRRYLPKLYSSDKGERSRAERQVINTIVQSSAGDVNNYAIIKIQKHLEEEKYKALIAAAVHDSIINDCPDAEIEEVSQITIDYMTKNIPKVTVPLKVDLKIEEKWTK